MTRTQIRSSLIATISMTTMLIAKPTPRVVKTVFPTDDVAIASVELRAPEDASADSAPAIQGAIDSAADGGGGVVFLHAGMYRLAASITVREGVTLRGERPLGFAPGTLDDTVLTVIADRGEEDGTPAITVERGTGVCDLSIWYPEQSPEAPVPYPWTIMFSETHPGDNMTVRNVALINPWQGIKVGPGSNELHTIRNVVGTPLRTGLWFDSTTDIGRVTHVYFGARFWERSDLPGAPTAEQDKEALRSALARDAVGVDIGRSDWEYIYDLRVDGYATGLRFRKGKRGVTNAVMVHCELRNCGTALQLDDLNPTGIAATACVFGATQRCVYAPASFRNTVAQFNSCEFTGEPEQAILLEGDGLITVQGCRFGDSRNAAIECRAGQLSVLDCDFSKSGDAVVIGRDARRARVLSNRFADAARVVNRAELADVWISDDPLPFRRPDVTPHREAPARRPPAAFMVDVTTCGASAGAQDNTTAFAEAMERAKSAGGGTVYVPAGNYRFAGTLTVPTGVELRGIFDVPHHTQSGGSVLMPTAGRGDDDGTQFVSLESGSGLRGLTFWYPDQDLRALSPYPWTIRALGPYCWIRDVTLGNSYQGVDFWTHPSAGHVIRYLAGCVLKRGLWISKSDGDGWLEDLQFNPHYGLRMHPTLPRPKGFDSRQAGGPTIDYQRCELAGIVFGRCQSEHVRGTFLYAAYDGIAFRDDNGGTNARVVIHGTDTGSRAAVLECVGDTGVEFLNAQLVPLGKYVVAGIVSEPSFAGRASFFNSQFWAGPRTALLRGNGDILLQQLTTRSGDIRIEGGQTTIENANFATALDPHISIGGSAGPTHLTACLYAGGAMELDNASSAVCTTVANGERLPWKAPSGAAWQNAENLPQIVSFEGAAGIVPNRVARTGGGVKNMKEHLCRVVEHDKATSGTHVLELSGQPGEGHAYVYFDILRGSFRVYPDTVLRYRIMPLNGPGRCAAIDLDFQTGKPLRDRGVPTATGEGTHPGTGRGKVGEWTDVAVPIGAECAGQIIRSVMCAYDSRAGGPFRVLFDDIRFVSKASSGDVHR